MSNYFRLVFERRMHHVIQYIDENLSERLDIFALAQVANFSPYHFHRVFSAWLGESVGDYLWRRRLEVGALRLMAQPRSRVLDVALSVGFGSSEAFARAFRRRFECSPSMWRRLMANKCANRPGSDQRNSNLGTASRIFLTNHLLSSDTCRESGMNVNVVERKDTTVAYIRHLGPYGESIPRFWLERYLPWSVQHNLPEGHARYGISHDSPCVTEPARCRYDACAEIPQGFAGDALKQVIPGGKYAVLYFKGNVAQVGEAWASLLRDWLPSSGFQLDSRPCFEYYPEGAIFDVLTGNVECEITIPVIPA